MWGRSSLAALGTVLLASAAPAYAQKEPAVATAPLTQLDPWAVGWLGKADAPVPATFWSNTDTAALAALLDDIKPAQLSAAGRQALRRIMLSSAKAPAGSSGAPDIIPERLRILEQLGETDKSIDLRRKFPKADWSKGADRLAAEMELVSGRNETACQRVAAQRADDPNWMPLRALCYALAKDFNAAGLVSEQLLDVQKGPDGKPDTWLISAVETMREPTKSKPVGRYATAFETAVSIAAKLSVPSNAMAATPTDVAFAVIKHPNATPDQKRAALRVAIDTGRLQPSDVLPIMMVPPDDKADGRPAARAATRPVSDFLALALAAAAKPDLAADARSAAFAAALKAADTPEDARIAAYALHDALKALAKTEASAPNADVFARAGILSGDLKLAADWRKLMDTQTGDKADPWAAARIDLMLGFASGDDDHAKAQLQKLIDALPDDTSQSTGKSTAKAPAKAPPPAQRQLDLRRIETTRVLFLYVGAGRALTPANRTLLAAQKTAGRGVPDAALARIAAASDQNAPAEAALAAIAQLGPDTSALSFSGFADLLTALRHAGLTKDADALALESLQVWKSL